MPEQLIEARIALSDLFLDPNNPRTVELRENNVSVGVGREHEEGVQKRAMEHILNERYEVLELKESFRKIGFLPVDRLVVVELQRQGKYMVIEGNRRLAALKSLVQDYDGGVVDLKPEIKDSIEKIPVLIIEDNNKTKRDHFARLLQGVRHVSGIKPWKPYHQAQIIVMMLDDGKQLSEVRESLGLSSMRVNSLRRSSYGLLQMQQDPEYKDYAKPEMFSHFEEAYKQPRLRAWLGWNDENNLYANKENRRMFYSWCVPSEEDGIEYSAKVVDAKELRVIGKLMDNQALFRQFCDSPTLRLPNAMQGIADDAPIDWQGALRNNLKTLEKIPAVSLMAFSDQDIQLIEKVRTLCVQLIQQFNLGKGVNVLPTPVTIATGEEEGMVS